MSMRASRLARLAYARIGSRTSLATSLRSSRSPIFDKIQIRQNGSPGIRLLASLAAQPADGHSVRPSLSQPGLNTTVATNDLQTHVEAVDGLLRSGVGGSDVWTERLQVVKDDLRVQRPPRIAGKIFNVADANVQLSETQSQEQKTSYPRYYRTQYQIQQQAGKHC